MHARPRPMPNQRHVFTPNPGSQVMFMSCPHPEVLLHGNRGGGKTDILIMDFLRDVGAGWGANWRGILFRQTYKQLEDVVAKCWRWIPLIFPGAEFNKADMKWKFPWGEELLLRYIDDPDKDYANYHGHAYPWIGWEELTNWKDDKCFRKMISCNRSSVAGVPLRIRATTNPYGVGHSWVKQRYSLRGTGPKVVITRDARDLDGNPEPIRVAIRSSLDENRVLLEAQPDYRDKIRQAADNPAILKAWLSGDWDVVSGGMFDDCWAQGRHVLRPFAIPHSWTIDRSFDWGSSRPFSVGWWAQSDGSDYVDANGDVRSSVRGDLFRIYEWYGWNGRERNVGTKLEPAEITKGIRERERKWGIAGRVAPGPADSSIFEKDVAYGTGLSIADGFAKQVRLDDGTVAPGVVWLPADKRPGSRKAGWINVRTRLKQAIPIPGCVRERPGLFIFSHCDQFLTTFPVLPRDPDDPDDVNTEAEDHIGDEVRYRIHNPPARPKSGSAIGAY